MPVAPDAVPTVLRGPHVGRRQVLSGGSPYWGTVVGDNRVPQHFRDNYRRGRA